MTRGLAVLALLVHMSCNRAEPGNDPCFVNQERVVVILREGEAAMFGDSELSLVRVQGEIASLDVREATPGYPNMCPITDKEGFIGVPNIIIHTSKRLTDYPQLLDLGFRNLGDLWFVDFAKADYPYTPDWLLLRDGSIVPNYRVHGINEHLQGNWEEAEDYYRKALEIFPDDAQVIYNVACQKAYSSDEEGAAFWFFESNLSVRESTLTFEKILCSSLGVFPERVRIQLTALFFRVPFVEQQVLRKPSGLFDNLSSFLLDFLRSPSVPSASKKLIA